MAKAKSTPSFAVQHKKLSDFAPDKRNANRGTERGAKAIAQSLKDFGAGRSILLDKHGNIIAGNKTAENAGAAGMGDVLVVQTDGTKLVAVQRMDLDLADVKAKGLAIADNRAGELSLDWDPAVLESFASEIDLSPYFSKDELAALLPAKELLTDEDDVPETPVTPVTQVGDLYLMGEHRLLCGDSTVITDVERLMDGAKADMVFTDPPYGMFLDTDYDQMFASDKAHRKTGKRFDKVIGDHGDFVPELISTIFAAFPDTPEVFIWGADYFSDLIPDRNEGAWIVWDKRCGENMDKVSGNTFELCWSKQKHKRLIARILWSGHHGMQGDGTKTRVHPTQKPVALAEWFFDQWGKSKEVVADLFGGSGSTLIAAEKTGRRCYMMELSPSYVDVIVTRWQNATGKKAVLHGAA